jgi:hypothetical protein
MTSKFKVAEDGLVLEPLTRHHCPVCRALTLAPLGQAEVRCSACRTSISDERAFVELYGAYVARRLGDQRRGAKFGDGAYASEDAKITFRLVGSR